MMPSIFWSTSSDDVVRAGAFALSEMLPKSNHALYGSGIAGDTWRGFEVDQFGAALAKSDPLNLAPQQGGVKLAASAGVANLFGNGFDEPQPGQSITPFST